MIFFSDDIINYIIDHSELENIITEIETFKNTTKFLIQKYSFNDVHYKYIENLLSDEKNKVCFYCLDMEFNIYNCPTMLIYHKYSDNFSCKNEINYYILMFCTKKQFRNQGYASKLLDCFIEHIKVMNNNNNSKNSLLLCNKKIKITLSSVENAVLFYESYGFIWKKDSLCDHKILMKYEKYEENKEYFIMEMNI
jgi:ribosomal protein S18 acetylase RimI-like enzyme